MAGGIPTYHRQLRAPGVPNEAKATGDDYSSITRSADGLVQLEQAIVNSRAQEEVTDARLEATRGLNRIEEDIDRDPDYPNAEKNHQAGALDLKGKIAAGIKSPRARRRFDRSFDGLAETRRHRIKKTAFRKEQGVARAKLDEALKEWGLAAAQAATPAERKKYIELAAKGIAGATKTAQISPGAAVALGNAFKRTVRTGRWEHMAATNPRGVLDASGSVAGTLGIKHTPRALRSFLTKGKAHSHADGMNPEFARRFLNMMQAAPAEVRRGVTIFSGFRSNEHQARLFKNAVHKYGSSKAARKWVAPPGGSDHNRGEAGDLRFASPAVKKWMHANAGKHGLHFRMGHEPWHISLDRKSTAKVRSAADPDFSKMPLSSQRRIVALAGGIVRKEEIALNGERKELGRSVTEIAKMYESGLPPREDMISAALAEAARLGMDDVADRIEGAAGEFSRLRNLAASKPGDVRMEVELLRDKIKGEGATPELAGQLDATEKLYDNMQRDILSDPLEWADSHGVKDVAPLPVGAEVSAFAKALGTRYGDAKAIAEHYDVPIKLFTGHEAAELAKRFEDAPPDQKAAMAAALVKAFGGDADAALGEIGQKGARTQVHLASLIARGNNRAAADGFAGMAMLAEGTAIPGDKQDFAEGAAKTLGGALDPARFPDHRNTILQSAKAIYVARAARAGKAEFDEELYAQALNEAAGAITGPDGVTRGGIGGVHNSSVILPGGVSEDDFESALEHLPAADLKRLSVGGGAPVFTVRNPKTGQVKYENAKPEHLRNGWLVTAGNGQYYISMTDPAIRAEYIRDGKTGGYYAFSLDKDALTKRPVLPLAIPENSPFSVSPHSNFDADGKWHGKPEEGQQ